MNNDHAILALSALAQATRLHAFRILVRAAPDGLAAGKLAIKIDVPQNTLSTHLGILQRAGLVTSERRSREIHYSADLEQVRLLTLFLLQNCCEGRPELCEPVITALTCCEPSRAARPRNRS